MDPTRNSAPLYCYRFGTAEFHEARMELRVGEAVVELEPKPRQVLQLLLRRAGEVVTKDELFGEVWFERHAVSEQVLTNAISKLRKALGEPQARCIVVVPRAGYQLAGGVERIAVGRKAESRLSLQAGMPVPERQHFVLQTQLGSSGGSEVWLARHTKAQDSRVFKFAVAGEYLDALKREVTLARLLLAALGKRPDIATILAWNFASLPFYLEYEVWGENLERWDAAGGRLAALTMPQRLEVFLQIARAVAAAHSVGVLHKDLKPANVLVAAHDTGGWQLRVTDFGSGHLLEPNRLEELGITRFGLTAPLSGSIDPGGTAFYTAPELTEGKMPTTQSDIFALGIMLYQIVIADLRHRLVPGWENDVADELLREDIAAMTDGSPERRLKSVADIVERLSTLEARRLQRHAERRALIAEEQQKRERLRRPWRIAAMVSMALGLTLSTWLYRQERSALQQAEHQRVRAESINRFNQDLFAVINPIAPGALTSVDQTALAALASKRNSYFEGDPHARGSIDASLGSVYFGIGDYRSAAKYQREASLLLVQALGPQDPRSLTVQYALVRTLDMQGRHAEARSVLAAADRAAGKRLQQPSPLSLLAAWTHARNAAMELQPATALPHAQRAEQIRRQVAPDDPVWLVRTRSDLAWSYVRLARDQDAIEALEVLMTPQYSPQRLGVMDFARARFQYGLALRNSRQFDAAEQAIVATLQELEKTLGSKHYIAGVGWSHLAAVHRDAERWQPAYSAATRAHEILRNAAGAGSRAELAAQGDIAILDYLSGDLDRALPRLQRVYGELCGVVGSANALAQLVGFYLGSALRDSDRASEARKVVQSLDAATLAAGDPSRHWNTRLQKLRADVRVH